MYLVCPEKQELLSCHDCCGIRVWAGGGLSAVPPPVVYMQCYRIFDQHALELKALSYLF